MEGFVFFPDSSLCCEAVRLTFAIPRDCDLNNALCFETYKMLLQVFLRAFCILPTGVILAYLLPPDSCGKSKKKETF